MNDLAVKLKLQVNEEINKLRRKDNPQQLNKNFDAVWVFSGPGTIKQPLKESDVPTRVWMDRDRILYGAELIAKITAKRLQKKYTRVTSSDIKKSGPFLIYNGIRIENVHLRETLQYCSNLLPLPYQKVYIIDEVVGKNGIFYPIRNTLDQIKSFPTALINYGVIKKRIAIVSHAEHFPRILRYIKKYNIIPEDIKIAIFPLKSPETTRIEYHQDEVNKVWEYFQKGHLSWNPISIEEDPKRSFVDNGQTLMKYDKLFNNAFDHI